MKTQSAAGLWGVLRGEPKGAGKPAVFPATAGKVPSLMWQSLRFFDGEQQEKNPGLFSTSLSLSPLKQPPYPKALMLNEMRPYILKGKVEEDFGSISVTVHWIGFLDRCWGSNPSISDQMG